VFDGPFFIALEVDTMDVFFFEAFEEEALAIRHFLPDGLDAGFTWKTIQEYGGDVIPAPVISVRTQSVIPASWSEGLEAILTRSTGYDHIVQYLEQTGTSAKCGYLPLYCHRAVAEQAMMLWMALLRKLPQQMESFHVFHRDGLTGREAAGKTLMVVGVGNIGSEVVKIGQGLDMRVLGVDLEQRNDFVNYLSLETGLPQADIVVCAMNLTPENEGYFNREVLSRAKPGVIFVNVARGELSPMQDLLCLLEAGVLGAVGLDVYNHESELAVSLRTGTPAAHEEVQAVLALAERDDVILTPHNAFNTQESVERKAQQSVQQLEHYMETKTFLWPVDITG
jgi:D-lactate dehydrogenase